MDKFKTIATVLASAYGISFFAGMFSWYLADGFVMLLGLVMLVCIVWLLVLAYGKGGCSCDK